MNYRLWIQFNYRSVYVIQFYF